MTWHTLIKPKSVILWELPFLPSIRTFESICLSYPGVFPWKNWIFFFFFARPRLSGISKYDPIFPRFEVPNNCFVFICTASSTVLPNWIDDFKKSICCPDTTSYCLRMWRIVWHSSLLALQTNKLSSANRRWDIDGLALAILKSEIDFFSPPSVY